MATKRTIFTKLYKTLKFLSLNTKTTLLVSAFLKVEVEHLMKLHSEWRDRDELVYKRGVAGTYHVDMAGRFKRPEQCLSS